MMNSPKALIKIKFVCPLPTDQKISRRLKRFYWGKKYCFCIGHDRSSYYFLSYIYRDSCRKVVRNLEINAQFLDIYCVY